ncbi:arginyltransferase [Curvivirga sp.]|uniref:arginyltransferase n=1 Tax=Curvivirga sp. TaxID=2856848 RepID=UPI003B58E404
MSIQRPAPIQIFHRSNKMKCPYIDGEVEQQLFTEVSGEWAQYQFNRMSQAGFRRSHNIIYRPTCPNCNACKSVRINVSNFDWKKGWKRILRKNSDLTSEIKGITITDEQYALFKKYVTSRHHDGEMADMSRYDFENMIKLSPVDTRIIEYRDNNNNLKAACLTDILPDGWSAVYSFFDSDLRERSFGSFIILDMIQKMENECLPYVYLGYWIKNSPKMAYKERFTPLEYYDKGLWNKL